MSIKLLIAMLPVVFMFHDFEEIIMFKPWLEKNQDEVKRRFPRLGNILKNKHERLSTSSFAVAVLHEFLLITLVTCASLYFDFYHWWFGAFAAFSLHLIVHLAQWVIYGKYVPVVLTSILALPYCIYVFVEFLKITDMKTEELFLWAAAGIILTLASFIPAFSLASRFEDWKNRNYPHSAD